MNSDLFKQYKWQNIIIAVIYILFGIVLAIFPTTAVKTLGYMLWRCYDICGCGEDSSVYERKPSR